MKKRRKTCRRHLGHLGYLGSGDLGSRLEKPQRPGSSATGLQHLAGEEGRIMVCSLIKEVGLASLCRSRPCRGAAFRLQMWRPRGWRKLQWIFSAHPANIHTWTKGWLATFLSLTPVEDFAIIPLWFWNGCVNSTHSPRCQSFRFSSTLYRSQHGRACCQSRIGPADAVRVGQVT